MNKNKLQSHSHSSSGRARSLGLVNMALPLTGATPPQLRHRRHFQFNGVHFEANPLSLQSPRSSLDGDAGDARYSSSSEQRRDAPSFPFKSSASHLQSLRGGDNISVTKTATQQHGGGYNTQMHQSSERVPWRAANDNDNGYDNCMAGGEDVYGGGSSIEHEHMHRALPRYSRLPSDDEYNSNNYNNYNNNGNNNNANNNYINSRYNNTSCNDSYVENDDNNIKIDQNTLEQRPIPTGIDLQRPSKPSEFQNIHMRAGDGTKAAAVAHSKMDYITLAGFLLGYLTSNVLFFLCWYFSWLKGQVMKLRKHFLGQSNLWEFFDFEDTTRYSMQTKLILAPLILICSILYCVVNILHLMIKLVRSDVPRTVVDLVQRIVKNYWP